MRDILNTYSATELKTEIKKYNAQFKAQMINGYSKMKKSELVDAILKKKDKFTHLKAKTKAPKPVKKALVKKETPKPVKKEPVKKERPKLQPKPQPKPQAKPKNEVEKITEEYKKEYKNLISKYYKINIKNKDINECLKIKKDLDMNIYKLQQKYIKLIDSNKLITKKKTTHNIIKNIGHRNVLDRKEQQLFDNFYGTICQKNTIEGEKINKELKTLYNIGNDKIRFVDDKYIIEFDKKNKEERYLNVINDIEGNVKDLKTIKKINKTLKLLINELKKKYNVYLFTNVRVKNDNLSLQNYLTDFKFNNSIFDEDYLKKLEDKLQNDIFDFDKKNNVKKYYQESKSKNIVGIYDLYKNKPIQKPTKEQWNKMDQIFKSKYPY